jgi:hypothetical protein
MQSFTDFVPKKSIPQLQFWIDELDVLIKLTKPRKTKLGDFRIIDGQMIVSINNNLNPYSFLITLTHELAHAFVYEKYKHTTNPHGIKWQLMFKSMLLNFLSPTYFPQDILKALSLHIRQPKASTLTDIALSCVLKTYDVCNSLTLSEIKSGVLFTTSNGKIFIKGPKLRKRYKCIEQQTKRVYLFHPLADVSRVQ